MGYLNRIKRTATVTANGPVSLDESEFDAHRTGYVRLLSCVFYKVFLKNAHRSPVEDDGEDGTR